LRIEAYYLRARCALAAATRGESVALLNEARRAARAIVREGDTWGLGMAALVRASLAARAGNRDTALAEVERAAERFRERDMRLFVRIAEIRRGELLGDAKGARLIEEAIEWMRGQEIDDPPRVTALFAPGRTVETRPHSRRHPAVQ